MARPAIWDVGQASGCPAPGAAAGSVSAAGADAAGGWRVGTAACAAAVVPAASSDWYPAAFSTPMASSTCAEPQQAGTVTTLRQPRQPPRLVAQWGSTAEEHVR